MQFRVHNRLSIRPRHGALPAIRIPEQHRLRWPALLGGLLLALTVAPTYSQNSPFRKIQVLSTSTCRKCTITSREVARIGNKGGVIVEWPQSMWQDTRGRYIVMQPNRPEQPQVFDSTGRFLRVLGRAGEGPGEFRNAAIVFGGPRDSINVVDWATLRISVLDANLEFVRSMPTMTSPLNGVSLSGGQFVLSGILNDRAHIGLPFHLFDRQGTRIGTWGDRTKPYLPSNQIRFVYRLAAARRRGFWAVPLLGQYQIEHWQSADSAVALVRPDASWYVSVPENLRQFDVNAKSPPVSFVYGIWEDSAGLVWVFTRIGDLRGPGARDTLSNLERSYSAPKDADLEYDTMVEVIDPVAGSVVVSQRFDDLFYLALGNGKVVHVDERPDGGVEIQVLRLRLVMRH